MRNLALSGLFAVSLFSSGVLAESVTINTPLSGWHKQSGENAYYSQQVNYPASSVNTRSGQSIDAQIQGVISDLPKDNRQPGLLIVNGISMPQRIEDDGSFQRPYIFPNGSNSIEVRSPDRKAARRVQFYATQGQGAIPAKLRIVLSWDSDNTDIDLHVVTPDGEHAWYGNRNLRNGGSLDMDVTTGYGPEIFSTPTPVKGPWLVLRELLRWLWQPNPDNGAGVDCNKRRFTR
ncbi:Uncharacterized protein conserved in bacteria [Salmonella enterica subsp. salamae]|uniref:Uncharacterized protein conserved in bacteria n=1 Tax=Salmonella enterica subsp. salamae TaxID=59202 RepID=A0A6D2G6G2_SALER|nr:Uncharacterized protein conserved in bacteria [Salmonella enterica subsp. salamae]